MGLFYVYSCTALMVYRMLNNSGHMDYLFRDIIRRQPVFNLVSAREYSMRDFISPVLISALTIVKDCKIVAVKQLAVSLGNGPIV